MTASQWVQFAQFVVMALVGLIVWSTGRAFKAGQWTQTLDRADDIKRLEARMDRAGQQFSDLATKVQAIPDQMRQMFVGQEIYRAMHEEHVRESVALHAEIDKLWAERRRQP